MKTSSTLTAVVVNAQLASPEMHSGAVCISWLPCQAHRSGCAAWRFGSACHSWKLPIWLAIVCRLRLPISLHQQRTDQTQHTSLTWPAWGLLEPGQPSEHRPS